MISLESFIVTNKKCIYILRCLYFCDLLACVHGQAACTVIYLVAEQCGYLANPLIETDPCTKLAVQSEFFWVFES